MSGKVTCEWGECTWEGPVEAVKYPAGKVLHCCDQCAGAARTEAAHLLEEEHYEQALKSYGRNKGKKYRSRGGRPPRLYEALEVAWKGIKGEKLDLMQMVFIEATLTYERERRAARLRAREVNNASLQTD